MHTAISLRRDAEHRTDSHQTFRSGTGRERAVDATARSACRRPNETTGCGCRVRPGAWRSRPPESRGPHGPRRRTPRPGLVAGHRARAAAMSDAGSGRTRVGVDIGGTFTDLVARGGERTHRSRACPGNLRGRHRDHGERRAGPRCRAWTRPPSLRAARDGWGGPGPCLVSRREARYRARRLPAVRRRRLRPRAPAGAGPERFRGQDFGIVVELPA